MNKLFRQSKHLLHDPRGNPLVPSAAYLMRWLRHRHDYDLPCHGGAQAIAFYLRLLPCQPRATPTTNNKRRAYRPAVY